jgi:hypothetical protein
MASRTPFSLDLTHSLGAANCYEKLGGGNRTPIRYLKELGLLDESQARSACWVAAPHSSSGSDDCTNVSSYYPRSAAGILYPLIVQDWQNVLL